MPEVMPESRKLRVLSRFVMSTMSATEAQSVSGEHRADLWMHLPILSGGLFGLVYRQVHEK
jgi:hypothetical protein